MRSQNPTRIKLFITCLVTILVFGFLFWEHFNGGVISHHLLNKKDLPAISNWWGGILMPVLTWFLLGRIEKRLEKLPAQTPQSQKNIQKVFWLFLAGLILGILISTSFTKGFKPFLDNVLYILLALSLLVPIYYAEFVLGFILGMTFTFGAILPTAFISVFALIGMIIYRYIRPAILKLFHKIGKSSESTNR